jgi:SAM-dependent MidA family methyltransferase
MFGEMIGLWLLTGLRNYNKEEELKNEMPILNSLNLVEIGPGSGIMMSDILRVSLPHDYELLIDSLSVHRQPQKHQCESD